MGCLAWSVPGVHRQLLPTSWPGLLPLLYPATFLSQAWAHVLIWLLIVTDFSPGSISNTSRSCLLLLGAQNHPELYLVVFFLAFSISSKFLLLILP